MLLLLWGSVKALSGSFYLAFEHTVTNAAVLFILEWGTGFRANQEHVDMFFNGTRFKAE